LKVFNSDSGSVMSVTLNA